MPVAKPRRLLVPTAQSLYDRLSREALSCVYNRRELDELESTHPELTVEDGPNILAAVSHGDAIVLPYAFESTRAFHDRFAGMFDKLLPRARKAYRGDTVRFRLTYGPARPQIEPVIRNSAFEPTRAWFQFSLAKSALTSVKAPRGITFRDGSIKDLDVLLSIDHEAFSDTPITRAGMQEEIVGGQQILIAERKTEPVGFAMFDQSDTDVGYLRTLAVRESARGIGVGAALTVRVAKAVFADGAPQLDLRTDDDNAAAIRLYNRLGFKHTGSGRDYERPADPRVVAAMRKQAEGTVIKFGGWR